VVRAGQDEDPVGGVRDVLVVEPDSNTVLPGFLKKNVPVEPVLTVRTDGIIKHYENFLTNQERPSATSANFEFFLTSALHKCGNIIYRFLLHLKYLYNIGDVARAVFAVLEIDVGLRGSLHGDGE
jgi:hypothetical protein